MNWLEQLFGQKKPIIGMCHLLPLPGDPGYLSEAGFSEILAHCRTDLSSLQDGGVDGVMFSNEGSLPYLTSTDPITAISMARVIGEIREEINIPFGVNVLWDPKASIELAVATGAKFVREVFTGAYAGDFGLWNTDVGRFVRHRNALGGKGIRLLFNIVPESASYLSDRSLTDIARSTVFNARPDALCISGLTAGQETSASTLRSVKEAVPGVPILANTGVKLENLEEQLSIADGAVVGTALKVDGDTWKPVDPSRVAEFMSSVQRLRSADTSSSRDE